MGWIWVLVPLAAILAWPITKWMEFKKQQAELGTSADELGQRVELQATELSEAMRRIENLESIVAHEVWEKSSRIVMEEPSDTERIDRMSRGLRT